MVCNSFWGPTWLWQEALTSLVFPHTPICPVFLFVKLLPPFPKKKKSQPPYAPNVSFSAFPWFSFINLSHFSTPTSNPGWNYCFPQHFHFHLLRPAFCLIQKPLEDGERHSSLLSDKDFLLKCIFSSTSKSSGNTETSTHQGLYTYRNTSTHSSNPGLYQE